MTLRGVVKVVELELELIQSQMKQKPMMRGEAGAIVLRVTDQTREEVWASAGGLEREATDSVGRDLAWSRRRVGPPQCRLEREMSDTAGRDRAWCKALG